MFLIGEEICWYCGHKPPVHFVHKTDHSVQKTDNFVQKTHTDHFVQKTDHFVHKTDHFVQKTDTQTTLHQRQTTLYRRQAHTPLCTKDRHTDKVSQIMARETATFALVAVVALPSKH